MGPLLLHMLLHLWLPTLLPPLLPMLLPLLLMLQTTDMLAPSTLTLSSLLTPTVLLSLLMSQLLLLPVLSTSPLRELSMLLRPQLLPPLVLTISSPRVSMAESMLTLHLWLPMVVSWLTPTEPLSQLMSLPSQQPGLNTSLSWPNMIKNFKNQIVC